MNAYDVLETHSTDNDLCRLILNFMVNNPLEKYTKVRLINIEDALQELNEIAKYLVNLSKLMENDQNMDETFENMDKVVTVFMIHVCNIFARDMVEILMCLSFTIEPHIKFWENQYQLNNKHNRYKIYSLLNKIYNLSISSRRARIFKKLLSDLYVQIGHIQWWFWGLIKLKKRILGNNNSDIDGDENIFQFISEMNELFGNQQEEENNNDGDKKQNVLDLMIETISVADSFVIKMQKDIVIWGMPSHWRRNYKIYSVSSVSIMFSLSIFSYYKLQLKTDQFHTNLNRFHSFFIEKFYKPIEQLFYALFKENKDAIVQYDVEKEKLTQMKEISQLKYNANDSNNSYSEYIEDGKINGPLLSNIFIQIQKVKVELSALMISMHGINYKMNAFYFTIAPLYLLFHHIQHKKKRLNKKELRHIFRSMYSVLIKNYDSQFVQYEECGLILFLMYKCCVWAQSNLKNKLLSVDEYQWLTFDINHFISREFTVQQQLSLLKRMETYYL